MVSQALLTWAKLGLWNSDMAHVYASPNEDEEFHDDYPENGEKSMDGSKGGDKAYIQKVIINRTKPQPCDQEVSRQNQNVCDAVEDL